MKHNEGFLRGQRHFLRGEYGRSILGFGLALESGMDPAKVHLPLGLAYLKNSNFAEAITEFSLALEDDPTNDNVLFLRGMARCNRGEMAGAVDDFTTALHFNPRRAMALVGRSLAYRSLHRDEAAKLDMQAALDIGGVEVELFIREYCLAPPLQSLAMALFDVHKLPWGHERGGGSALTH